jgi:hypothetical protein
MVEDLPQPEGPENADKAAVRANDVEIFHGGRVAVVLPDAFDVYGSHVALL